jgi:HD-like signal output (HDOD) protein
MRRYIRLVQLHSEEPTVTREASDLAAHHFGLDRRIRSLPPLPAVVTRLLPLDPGDDFYLDHVYRLARQDPTLTVRAP